MHVGERSIGPGQGQGQVNVPSPASISHGMQVGERGEILAHDDEVKFPLVQQAVVGHSLAVGPQNAKSEVHRSRARTDPPARRGCSYRPREVIPASSVSLLSLNAGASRDRVTPRYRSAHQDGRARRATRTNSRVPLSPLPLRTGRCPGPLLRARAPGT
jgi:hypothetical protein